MDPRPLHHAFVIALFVAAPVAAAQTGTAPSASHDTTTSSAKAGSRHASAAHPSTHPAARAGSHPSNAGASHAGNGTGNAQYEAALRRCVQMSGNERERCLDEAIARYAS